MLSAIDKCTTIQLFKLHFHMLFSRVGLRISINCVSGQVVHRLMQHSLCLIVYSQYFKYIGYYCKYRNTRLVHYEIIQPCCKYNSRYTLHDSKYKCTYRMCSYINNKYISSSTRFTHRRNQYNNKYTYNNYKYNKYNNSNFDPASMCEPKQ